MRRMLISFTHSDDGGNRVGRIPITAAHLAHPALQKKTLYRKFKTNIPGNETGRPHSQYLHSYFCGLFTCMYSQEQSVSSAAGK